MSVILKGMEMPKNCQDCQLLAWNGGYYCTASRTVIKVLRIQSRRDDCPLVEVNGTLFSAKNARKFLRENPPKEGSEE